MPVHGEMRHMTEHARLARSLQVPEAIVIENGQMLRLAPGRAEIIDETPSGRIFLDGKVLVDETHDHMRERRALAVSGVISITLVLDSKGRVAAEPSAIIEGIPDSVHVPIQEAIEEAVKRNNSKRGNEEALAENVRRASRRAALNVAENRSRACRWCGVVPPPPCGEVERLFWGTCQ